MSDDEKSPAGKKKESIVYSDVHFEVAKTSRAKCVECSVTIEKGEIKVSKEVNSQNGKVIKSFHPNCALHVAKCEDNRSKCQTCKEKLALGQLRVKVGTSCKTGPGTKHHYTCVYDKGSNAGYEKNVQEILSIMKKNLETGETVVAKTEFASTKTETATPNKKTAAKEKAKPKPRAKKVESDDEEDDDDEDDDEEEDEEDEKDDEDDEDFKEVEVVSNKRRSPARAASGR